ncbi:MAG: hypothetical protein LBS00_01660 [Synergistaceae bacterium]|jgi:hypothetical protein|nr:hypothetical protein [Synergistaceae bacterium]
MERRIAGIVRWLDRCLRACKAGALESALMDVECARADVERLRDEVWGKLERRRSARVRGRFFWVPLKVVLGAFLVVLTGATPVAFFQEGPALERQERETVSLEWVTPDEKTLLGNLRKHLSDSNSFASIQDRAQIPAQPMEREAEREPAVRAAPKAAPKQEPKPAVRDEALNIPYDRIISLVQAGEKAMQKDEPAIKVEKVGKVEK